jgi:hypothetical protein
VPDLALVVRMVEAVMCSGEVGDGGGVLFLTSAAKEGFR